MIERKSTAADLSAAAHRHKTCRFDGASVSSAGLNILQYGSSEYH